MKIYDVLYNWLQLKLVSEARPEDEAAKVSFDHMADILEEVHHAKVSEVKKDESRYYIHYIVEGIEKKETFPIEVAETLLNFINDNPERFEFK